MTFCNCKGEYVLSIHSIKIHVQCNITLDSYVIHVIQLLYENNIYPLDLFFYANVTGTDKKNFFFFTKFLYEMSGELS